MKKKKKRINSFKNWLLARDSSSRISTFPNYHSFLESSQPLIRDRSQIMDLFDSITISSPFYKFNQLFDLGLSKDAKQKKITIWINNKDKGNSILDFLECINPPSVDVKSQISIKLDDIKKTAIGNKNYTSPEIKYVYITIPSFFDDKKIVEESSLSIKEWIDSMDFKDDTANKFFKWWMENYIFKQEKYSNFLKSFESAFVEWMRVAPPEESGELYIKVINNSTDKNIKRVSTSIGTEEIIDHINTGIEQFNIPISSLKSGADLLRDFDLL